MRRGTIHFACLGILLFAILVSVAPGLHERLHPDAAQSQHQCVVTLLASGSYHHGTTPAVNVAPALALDFGELLAVQRLWVASTFSSARIFEHAPPQHS